MTISQKIGILRTANKYSQEQLADILEVSRQSVSKWESGASTPEVDKIIKMANLFNITTDDLIRDEIPLAPTYTESLFHPAESVKFNGKYFGTDGFRGDANDQLTADKAYKIGRFLGYYYTQRNQGRRAKIVIGKDTRRSSYMFEYAIVAGLTASGADAYMLHVTTTPSVSYVARQEQFDCGVMISASHNPYYDNGIKLINNLGEKMEDATLALVEDYIDGKYQDKNVAMGEDLPLAKREKIGVAIDHTAGRNRYVGYLISVAANSYRGLKIGLDCANGASWMIAKSVFSALGANIYVINDKPDGVNINEQAGSTHIGALRKFVRENHLDVGFAFDGDADRCIAVDENGEIVNGDHIMFVLAKRLKARGLLKDNTVVTTIMSNMGLYKALTDEGMNYIQTTVGDRYVYEAMVEKNFSIGGEQSGHVIVKKYASTGDGILTAILLAEEIMDSKSTLSKLVFPMKMFPQAIKNVTVTDKSAAAKDSEVLAAVEKISAELGGEGRILIRQSGTEPMVRVMVEYSNQKKCEAYVEQVAEIIKARGYCK